MIMTLYFRDKNVLFEDEDIQISQESSDNNSNSEIDTKQVQPKNVKITLDELEKKAQDSSMSMVAIAKQAWGLSDSTDTSENNNSQETPQDSSNIEASADAAKKSVSGAAAFNKELPGVGTV